MKNSLSENQKAILKILANNGSLSLQEVSDIIGLSLADVKKICLKLQEIGLLERKGSKRDGYWATR